MTDSFVSEKILLNKNSCPLICLLCLEVIQIVYLNQGNIRFTYVTKFYSLEPNLAGALDPRSLFQERLVFLGTQEALKYEGRYEIQLDGRQEASNIGSKEQAQATTRRKGKVLRRREPRDAREQKHRQVNQTIPLMKYNLHECGCACAHTSVCTPVYDGHNKEDSGHLRYVPFPGHRKLSGL